MAVKQISVILNNVPGSFAALAHILDLETPQRQELLETLDARRSLWVRIERTDAHIIS